MRLPVKPWRALGLGAAWALAGVRLGAADVGPSPRYTGLMAIREWSEEELHGATQCFSVVQAENTGLIYVGAGNGVLEYDGVRWRRLPLLTDLPVQAVRGLAIDAGGRIWAGLDNEILRYTADERGRWQVESVLSRLPESERAVGTVWQLREVAGSIWGVANKRLLRFERDGPAARTVHLPADLVDFGQVDGTLWLRQLNGALFWCDGETVEPAGVPAPPAGCVPLAVYRTPAGLLRMDHTRGVVELADGTWREIAPELGRVLQGSGVASRARRLRDGRGIFSTISAALVFVSADGRVLGRFVEPPGITFGVTPQTFLDRDGGLWVANANGIRRVQVDGVVARHDRALGLRGNVRDLRQHGDTLLVATTQGLFGRDPGNGKFELRSRGLSDLFQLAPGPVGGWLIVAGARFQEWTETGEITLPGAPRLGLALTRDPRDGARIFVGKINEVEIARREGRAWKREALLDGINVAAYSVAVGDRGDLWVAGGIGPGLWRAQAPGGEWAKAVLEPVALAGQAGRVSWRVQRLDGAVVAYGIGGLYRAEAARGPLEPDPRFAGLPKGARSPVTVLVEGARPGVAYVAGGRELAGRYWRGERRDADAAWEWTELPLAEIHGQIRPATLLESADGGTLWLGGVRSVISVDLRADPPPAFPVPAALWRGVRVLDRSGVIYGGAAERTRVALPLGGRAVEVEFAASSHRMHLGDETGMEFRTRAAGVDQDWTPWSKAAARELTNLPPGRVHLEVQARNHLGAAGPGTALVLIVPPFWWETWWLRSLVVLAAAAAVAAAVRWWVRRQFRQRIALLEAQAAVQNERLRIARDMHDDLGSTLASIAHLSSEPGPSGTRSEATLARIHQATRELVHRTRDIVWAATPQHDSLESLLERIAAHAERTFGDRGVEVRVSLPAVVPEEAVGAAARHDLFLAFKEAVNNAAKYAQARAADVSVELTARELVVTLRDDGLGFAPGDLQGTGHGLGNLQARLAALGGRADVASVVGRGTTVTLRLPRHPVPMS